MTGHDRPDLRRRLTLHVLPERLAVCMLPPESPVPEWATGGSFHVIARAADELSIVCDAAAVPPDVAAEGPWACLQVEGPLDFGLTGILAGLAAPLAEAGIPIFAVSTYRTDYVLVSVDNLQQAVDVLRDAGYTVR